MLAVTGAEALYADMGHFGRKPIRTAWLALVMPGLLLNYFGQGALIIEDPTLHAAGLLRAGAAGLIIFLVALATLATVIASQAVITGVFSLTRQAIQLGYLPRMEIQHTSETAIGQIYIPTVNWILMAGVVALVVGFGSSGELAGAYGLAVTGAMLVDAALAMAVAILVWKWRWPVAALVFGLLAIPDIAFFIANALKIPDGGWLPLVVAVFIYFTITTWRRGRRLVATEISEGSLPLRQFLERMERAPDRVAGTAVFLTADATHTPAAFLHNLKHNKVLHERIIILQVETMDVPRVADANRVEVERLGKGFHTVIARYGFMEQPDVPAALRACRPHGIAYDEMETSFFLGRETLVPASIPSSANGAATGSSRSPTRPRPPRPSSASRPTALSNWATRSRFSPRPIGCPARRSSCCPACSTRAASSSTRSPPWPTSPTRRARALAPRHDRRDGPGDAGAGAADLRARRLLDGRLRRLRDPAPRAPAGRTAGADGHPGHARLRRIDHAPPRPDRADQDRPLPWRAAHAAAAARAPPTHQRPTIIQPILDMAQEIGADGFVREQHAIIDRADSRRCWSTSTSRPW